MCVCMHMHVCGWVDVCVCVEGVWVCVGMCDVVCGWCMDMIPVSFFITFSYHCCSTETVGEKSHGLIKTNKRKQAKHVCLLHQRCRLLAGWASRMTWGPRVYWHSLTQLEGHREERDL